MFQPGDMVVYGTTGVCRVEEITQPNMSGVDRSKPYYLLKPLFQDGVIYTPVENGKVSIRPVISAKEAEALIDLIPGMQAEACRAPTLQALAQHYQAVVRSHDCRDLIELMMSIYAKRCQAEAQNRRLGMVDDSVYKFVWITDFPLFEYDEQARRYTAKHHPFTAPADEDVALLESAPEKVRAKAYDLVMNGVEMGSGSIRIHQSDVQEKMFKLLGFTKEQAWDQFGFLLGAFQYGTPPHGGFAFGIDRMVMILSGAESLRDVLAFPKIQNGACLMMETPSAVQPEQLEQLKIRCVE